MLQGYLVVEKDGRRVPIFSELTVGRTQDSGLVIEDTAASRRHVEIKQNGGRMLWRDLGSTNGTMINGSRMLAGELKDGDRIQIGETVLSVHLETAERDSSQKKPDSRLFSETILNLSGEVEAQSGESDKATALLEAVYQVVNDIADNDDPGTLMHRILETTLRAISGQRGAIFLSNEGGELEPLPACCVASDGAGGLSPAAPMAFQVSSTVTQRVLRHGESVLFQDSDADSEFNASASIMSLQLRSILCVPLRAKDKILGLLYIDSNRDDQKYNHDHLLLAAAVGNSAGIALENARMHRQMLDKQRIEQEIETAWTIQEGFLIKDWPNSDPRYAVYGETRPAKTVGGDFYDVVQPAPDVVGLLIGDVSGKGVPAALTMAQLLAEFRLFARDSISPATVLKRLNENLARRSRRGLFCTLSYLTLDLKTGALTCANAGHSPLLIIAREGTSYFCEASGPPAGILPDGPWHDEGAVLNPGESLLLYTDGIVEARSMTTRVHSHEAEPVEFESSGLSEAAKPCYGRPPLELIAAINAQVKRFCAPAQPHDDCTMIALRYTP